jgi:SAM-dependent methyltransferase
VASIFGRLTYKLMKPFHTRQCSCCGWHGFRFEPYGQLAWKRDDAMCPWCRSLERHRLVYLLMRDELEGARGRGAGYRTLHVAPEHALAKWLRGVSDHYLSIDTNGTAMANMDLMKLDLPDDAFTLVWCSHVLEHVPDDRQAMREMRRVLAPGGMAVIQVPVDATVTDEDPTIADPQERLRRFGQEDHVRIYGPDIIKRLESCGFGVEMRGLDRIHPEAVRRHSLSFKPTNHVFVCSKVAL